MRSPARGLLLALLSSLTLAGVARGNSAPSAHLNNGTYLGVNNAQYKQDFFLGIPYAQPPTGALRFAPPQPLTEAFNETRDATEYGSICIGYGSDTTNIGTPVSEDCLTLNVIRPEGTKPGDDLPVGIWVHGGSYVMGGSRDPRYNLSYTVDQAVSEGKPMVAVSINYRLSYWGFLFSQEMEDASAGNIAFRDQRLALRWVHDNIAAFGGSPDKVTIWGESAGARSLGMQLVAYNGQAGGLFRSAILESGSPVAEFVDAETWQPYYDAVVGKTGCSSASDTLGCLRNLPWETLNGIFNSTTALNVTAPNFSAVLDGDFMTAQATQLLREGKFAHVPLLLGNNFDEGTAYGKRGINTTAQFRSWLTTTLGLDSAQAASIEDLYPDDPAQGVPEAYPGRPAAYPYGLQWKRVAAVAGDYQQHAGRRLLAETYSGAGLDVYSYLWNVYVNGLAPEIGATHFQEVVFVFDNVEAIGYSPNPFEGKPDTYFQLADLMNKMWVSFIADTDPNHSSSPNVSWPLYTPSAPQNLVFDVNSTNLYYIHADDYREKQIDYLLESVF
ncbi:Carboxylesterase type B [Geosmithia morbida]|uniref:Carboxylic ester hydrolase n=1 Tax=Geosmithia morbida TaxID=1094350 RepID=A0A9P5D8Z0_9HYPO|nr:Carboxylesterase type B [Geosmithia morbida]KAF4125989.1 Carboxylesterase type B [Geosmithia morbida]